MDEIIRLEKRVLPLEDLHCQYTPSADMSIWKNDMGLPNSPHVEFFRLMLKHGLDWVVLLKSRYAMERRSRGWDERRIRTRFLERHDVLKSLKRGVSAKLMKRFPVIVMLEPFWKTRFGLCEDWLHGLELWDGAGRCSALYALGEKTVCATICMDAFPGTKSCKRLEDKCKTKK